MPNSRRKKPAYLIHKATGQARVRLNGKDVYLGPYESPQSRDRYEILVRDWLLANSAGTEAGVTLTIDDLALLYLDHAEQYYRHPSGELTSEVGSIRAALRPLVREFGTTRARDFGPRHLKRLQQSLTERGHCRTGINHQINRVRRAFKWAVENEYIPVTVYTALATVSSLKRGRTNAHESDPVTPVDVAVVEKTLQHVSSVLAAMIRLQMLTGARPGEICALRPCDVTFGTNGVWSYRPSTHKTAYRGKERRIFIGPEGQSILRPFLNRAPESFCFSPAESEGERRAQAHQRRVTPLDCGNRPGTRRQTNPSRSPGDRYTKDSYYRAVTRACELAFQMPDELRKIGRDLPADAKADCRRRAAEWRREHVWSPNQLRHSRATLVREKYGIEAAQVVLGHSDPRVTEIYAERDFEKAAQIMKEIG